MRARIVGLVASVLTLAVLVVVMLQCDHGARDSTEAAALDAAASAVKRARHRRTTEVEPNETPNRASPMRVEHEPLKPPLSWASVINRYSARGELAGEPDVDCYSIPLKVPKTGAVLRIRVTPAASTGSFAVVVWSEGRRLAVFAADHGKPVVVPAFGARAWVPAYAICVRATGAQDNARYDLAVDTLAPDGPFEFEPNGVKATASALPRRLSISGFLTDRDVDLFTVSSGPSSKVRATYTPTPGTAVELALLDANQVELAKVTVEAGKPASIIADRPAYLRLRAVRGHNTSEPYGLIVAPAPADARPANRP